MLIKTKPARKSPETTQEKADILWNEAYEINFLQEFETYMVEHSLQNKEIKLTECNCSKS